MLTKNQLISEIGQYFPHLPEHMVAEAVNLILTNLKQSLISKKRVEIRGFGNFDLRYRKARISINPKTGKKVSVPEKYAIHFNCGKDLKDKINASRK